MGFLSTLTGATARKAEGAYSVASEAAAELLSQTRGKHELYNKAVEGVTVATSAARQAAKRMARAPKISSTPQHVDYLASIAKQKDLAAQKAIDAIPRVPEVIDRSAITSSLHDLSKKKADLYSLVTQRADRDVIKGDVLPIISQMRKHKAVLRQDAATHANALMRKRALEAEAEKHIQAADKAHAAVKSMQSRVQTPNTGRPEYAKALEQQGVAIRVGDQAEKAYTDIYNKYTGAEDAAKQHFNTYQAELRKTKLARMGTVGVLGAGAAIPVLAHKKSEPSHIPRVKLVYDR